MRVGRIRAGLIVAAVMTMSVWGAGQQEVPAVAERNGALPGPFPLFPPDNWWNQDITQAPVDPRSAEFITFIGPTDGMHPEFGGLHAPGSQNIYGIPYAVVGADQEKVAVQFRYASSSDGVDHRTGQSYPFYPIPTQAITEPYWIEGGPPGNANVSGDRHMLIVDRDRRHLYELFALQWTGTRWEAGSGAFFDLSSNVRRPEGWTSADAAGLAILPGLVRYDEVFGPDEIRHAFRVTVHGVNGYVWPASHRADSNPAGPPLGTRLRLKPSTDISRFQPYIQKIFRAMKTHGLIVADTGADMFVTGAHDTRWNNGQLNPAFDAIKASDFEVIQLGWRGTTTPCTGPGAPLNLSATTSGLNASFSWQAPATGGALTDYVLEIGSTPGGTQAGTTTLPPSATSHSAAGVPGTYYARVRARNACGSAVSNEVTLTLTAPCLVPGAPSGLVVATSGLTATFSWRAPTAGGALTDSVLEIGRTPGGSELSTTVLSAAATSFSLTGPPGTYYVRVRARNGCGSAVSNEVVVTLSAACTVPGTPGPPVATVRGDNVAVSWTPAGGATSHVFEAGWLPGESNLVNAVMNATALSAQAPPGVYFVRARGRNACGTGPASPETMVAVGCSAPGPAAPLAYALSGRQVTLTWHLAAGATDYVLEAGTVSGAANVATIPVGGTSLSVSAPPGTYHVRVRPRNTCGSGTWSNEVVIVVA